MARGSTLDGCHDAHDHKWLFMLWMGYLGIVNFIVYISISGVGHMLGWWYILADLGNNIRYDFI